MGCWFDRCPIESRSSSSYCFSISNRKIWNAFRSRRLNSKITKRARAVLKNSARLVTRISISPASFDFPLQLFNLGSGGQFGGRAEIWKPLAFTDQQMKARYSRSFWIVGRLAPGTSAAQAQSEIETTNAQMRLEHADNYAEDNSFGGDVFLLQDLAVAGMRPALLILLGAVFLVL